MKCGGTSLRRAFTDAVQTIPDDRERRQVVKPNETAYRWTAGLFGMDDRRVHDILVCNALLQPTTRVVMGHLWYFDEAAPLAERAHFVTVLRHPVDRFVSLYRWRTYGNRPFMRFEGSIEELLDQRPDLAYRYGAAYVEIFRGGQGSYDRPVADGDVDAAIRNLRRFSVVGMLDDLDRFERELVDTTGLPVCIPHLNTNAAEPVMLDPGTRRAIEEFCRPSIDVYERVRAERGSARP